VKREANLAVGPHVALVIEAEMGSSQTCFKVQATAGAPEFGSAGLRWRSLQAQQLRRA
jgi:hypothetical protein